MKAKVRVHGFLLPRKFVKIVILSTNYRDIFVTLEEFSAFLCIKAVWGIKEKLGYELETVLNFTFCYKLHQRTPDAEPATVL